MATITKRQDVKFSRSVVYVITANSYSNKEQIRIIIILTCTTDVTNIYFDNHLHHFIAQA